MSRSIEARLDLLEAKIGTGGGRPLRSFSEAMEECRAVSGPPSPEDDANAAAELARKLEYDNADAAAKVAILKARIVEIDERMAEPSPLSYSRDLHLRVRRQLELDIIELEGIVSAEVLCVGRWWSDEALRLGKSALALPTHEEAVQIIEARAVPDYYVPEKLKPEPKRAADETLSGQVVPTMMGPKRPGKQSQQSEEREPEDRLREYRERPGFYPWNREPDFV